MRNTLVLLALVVVTTASAGCSSRPCRNLFRRGSPCLGTTRIAPAMMGAPMAIAAPLPAAQPVVMPQMIQQPCCPQVPACVPCPNECMPCESEGQQFQGEYFGGYLEGSVVGDCQDYGPVTTYGLETQNVTPPGGSGTRTDPGPTTQN